MLQMFAPPPSLFLFLLSFVLVLLDCKTAQFPASVIGNGDDESKFGWPSRLKPVPTEEEKGEETVSL